MRIRVEHRTVYRYQPAAKSVLQVLRLTPRSHEGQNVVRWRVFAEADGEVQLRRGEDAFGNVTHTAFVQGPVSELTLSVEGEVNTWDTNGLVRGSLERFPPIAFLRQTSLTVPSPELEAFAEGAGAGSDHIARLHGLMLAINAELVFDTEPTHAATTAAEAFALKRGVRRSTCSTDLAAGW